MSRNRGYRGPNLHIRGDNEGNSGAEVDSFLDLWAVANPATAPSGRTPNKADGAVPINARCRLSCVEEIIDLGGATSVFSTNNLLPANSLIFEIVTHCVTEFTTPTTYNVGDTGSNTRFATGLANDTVAEGPAYCSAHWAGTVAIRQTSAGTVKITPNAAGSGKVCVQVFYMSFLGGLAR